MATDNQLPVVRGSTTKIIYLFGKYITLKELINQMDTILRSVQQHGAITL
jgi:hypothetical protein